MDRSSQLSLILKILLVGNLVLVNGVVAWLVYQTQKPISPVVSTSPTVNYIDQCGLDCQNYIDTKVASLQATPASKFKAAPTPVPTPVVVYKTTPATKTRRVTYLTIAGSGSASNNEAWTSLAGTDFYFDPADYPGLVEVYWEANIRLQNGNGKALFQLYDSTHGIGVQGSDIQTSNQISTLVTSGKVTFWSGKNLIRVQAKPNTADTAIFDSGRLRIVTEN